MTIVCHLCEHSIDDHGRMWPGNDRKFCVGAGDKACGCKQAHACDCTLTPNDIALRAVLMSERRLA